MIENIRLSDFDYTLPEDRIAKFPLENRDHSKLIHFQNGQISHHRFYDIPDLLPSGSLIVFNNTKVIPARLIFQRESGAKIEIFLLKPIGPSTVINEVMRSKTGVIWQSMIGNLKRWKQGEVLKGKVFIDGRPVIINASLLDKEEKTVEFTWDGSNIPFVSIVESSGEVPLPPYLNRKATEEDRPRYQTVYSKKEGAVAAPTAGLHFTEGILHQLEDKGIEKEFLTLHVGAGTFQPVKAEKVAEHPMHSEQMVIEKTTVSKLAQHHEKTIAVGTTAMRSLESIYWFGVKLMNGEADQFIIPKLYPYQHVQGLPSKQESFNAVLKWMDSKGMHEVVGATEIFIMPGYEFRVCDGLITNFHQPSSTLILLIAAFTKGRWRKIYEEALGNDYRFLSYGDSNLIWK
jgi:S-adenosylmethionine:tRNA ribosyltransferase-isomerase